MFFQKYWDIAGNDTINMCVSILNDGEEVRPINNCLDPQNKEIEADVGV